MYGEGKPSAAAAAAAPRTLQAAGALRSAAPLVHGRNFESMVKESSASERKDMVDAPDLERHVFCSVLEDCGSVAIDETGCAPRRHQSPVHGC